MFEQRVKPNRSWEVLLIGGASGVGKTSISYRIAQHFGVGITEVDDFQVILERMTTPEQYPGIHYWHTLPEGAAPTQEDIIREGFRLRAELSPALEAVIANHLESQAPVVLEGDFIAPELAAQTHFLDQPNEGRVRALFVVETDEAQIVANYLAREPHEGEQHFRAALSWEYNHWLKAEAERLGLVALPARPWDDVLERALAALR
jgi:2-phosphoglycerate kinase